MSAMIGFHRALSVLLSFGIVGIFGSTAMAGDEEMAAGKLDFERHCAVCHGLDARGDGPLESYLIRKPSDLTLLRANADGKFPADRVAAIIDGRADVAAHGPREMPVWGYRFRDTPDRDADKGSADERIKSITRYLRSLQVSGE